MVQGTAGLAGPQAARRVAGQLTRVYGWDLTGSAGFWQGCRTQGWLLDRHKVCVIVSASQGRAAITMQTSDSW